MTSDDLVKLLNKVGEEVEAYMGEYDLTDEESQLVALTTVVMKQKIYEKLKNKI